MTRRLLLVHSGTELYGSDRVCLWIMEALIGNGWEVEIVLPSAGDLAGAAAALGVPVHTIDPVPLRRADVGTIRGLSGPLRWPAGIPRLVSIARSGGFDLVHTNTLPALGGWVAARAAGLPLVWSVHEILLPFRYLGWYQRLVRDADAVLCCSRAVTEQFQPSLAARCRVVHSGADLPERHRGTVPFHHPPWQISMVGRLNGWKGHDVLVDATRILVGEGYDVAALLIGGTFGADDRPLRRLTEQVSTSGVSERIRVLGHRPDAIDLVAGSDVFTLPSTRPEPFGIALVEAMALARPCVASASGGPLEIVQSGVDGILVHPGDPESLAGAIAGFIDDPSRAIEIGARAAVRALDFDRSRMTDEILAVYDEVASRSRRRAGRRTGEGSR